MENKELLTLSMKKAEEWLSSLFDEGTRNSVQELINNNEKELIESFYTNLEFGTGGLRGIMGVGTNRMNKYTVGMAVQGLANYIIEMNPDVEDKKIAVAHDSRNNSKFFADLTAQIFAANGFTSYVFDALRPTPELSFAVRYLNCLSGVVITASHNPKEYNGFKAYWNDGGQLVAPHDTNVIERVNKVSIDKIKFDYNPDNIIVLDSDFDNIYTDYVKSLVLSPKEIEEQKDMKIVYTALHGTGVRLVPECLNKIGFNNVVTVPEQDILDGNFPTVVSPNPEEKEALTLALKLADNIKADLVMATDPDGDRVGIAFRNENNELELLNGNQTAAILTWYTLSKWKENSKLKGKEFIVKTIVTTELLKDIAKSMGVEVYNVLTGFKYIAEIIRLNEDKKTFICGGEESYGFLVGDFVRDKDAVIACCVIAECVAWAKSQNKTLLDILKDVYCQYGIYKESLISITKKGKDGADEIKLMMKQYRDNPPKEINNSKLIEIYDYQTSICTNVVTGETSKIELPKSNVLQFITADGSVVSVRPSGTEPKIKFYFGVKMLFNKNMDYRKSMQELDNKIDSIIKSLNLK